jgi:hypothetical protein
MDNRIEVDGLPLPRYLVKLIKQGRWKTPSDNTLLKRLTGATGKTDLDLLSVDNMGRVNKLSDLFDDPKIGQIYGLASSNRTGQEISDLRILDVDKAILIGGNWDEEMICLDYRPNLENPCVVFSAMENRSGFRWKIVADDVKSFADNIGL